MGGAESNLLGVDAGFWWEEENKRIALLNKLHMIVCNESVFEVQNLEKLTTGQYYGFLDGWFAKKKAEEKAREK